jgi:uncharacterized protein (TIGR00255 family)
MLTSMTGFSRSEASLPQGSLILELRSVNHRFLEIALRLPEDLRNYEAELRGALQQALRRGKVDGVLTWRPVQQSGRSLELDAALLGQLRERLTQVAAIVPEGSAQTRVDLVDLLRFPGLLREPPADSEALLAAAARVTHEAIQGLVAMRRTEGSRLADTLEARCHGLATLVAQVRERLPQVQSAIRARFEERLGELRRTLDPDRLEQEITLLLQRLDVAEELDRLEGHLSETLRILKEPAAAGRRLDFLMQEFNREANTLSSKSQDLETTRLAVEMKVLIEQMREQVQNIE